jgi:hypothetical protein
MEHVLATVPDPTVRSGDAFHGSTTMLGPALFGGEGLLGEGEALRGVSGVTVVGDERPVARRNQHTHAQVDPDLAANGGQWLGGNVGAADGDPPASALAPHRDGLGGPPERAMQAHLDPTDPMQVQPLGRRVEAPTVAVLPLQRVPTAPRPKARVPRPLPGLATSIEGGERQVQAPQRTPTYRHTRGEDLGANVSQGRQSTALIDVRHRAMLPVPCPAALLERRVIQLALQAQQPNECCPLANSRTQQIPERTAPPHSSTVVDACDAQPDLPPVIASRRERVR